MVGAHGVFHRVFAGAAAHGHNLSGQIIGKGHAFTGLQIVSILHGPNQIFADIFNGGQGQHIAHAVMGLGNITLRAVKQCVKALVCRKFRRNRNHQLRVNDRQYRKQAVIAAKANFFIGFIIGNHAPLIRFGAGSGCRCNTDHRQCFFREGFPAAGAAVHVVPDVTVIGCHGSNRLRCVHHAAAAQGNDKVAAIFLCVSRTFHNGRTKWIRLYAVKQGCFHTDIGQFL